MRWLRLPPEPRPPAGSEASVRVFRAGPNYYRYALARGTDSTRALAFILDALSTDTLRATAWEMSAENDARRHFPIRLFSVLSRTYEFQDRLHDSYRIWDDGVYTPQMFGSTGSSAGSMLFMVTMAERMLRLEQEPHLFLTRALELVRDRLDDPNAGVLVDTDDDQILRYLVWREPGVPDELVSQPPRYYSHPRLSPAGGSPGHLIQPPKVCPNQEEEVMIQTSRPAQDSAEQKPLYVALELSKTRWKLAFSDDGPRRPRVAGWLLGLRPWLVADVVQRANVRVVEA